MYARALFAVELNTCSILIRQTLSLAIELQTMLFVVRSFALGTFPFISALAAFIKFIQSLKELWLSVFVIHQADKSSDSSASHFEVSLSEQINCLLRNRR